MDQSNSFFMGDIEKLTTENTNYRKVLYTGKLQLVLMNLKPSEEIGMEVHDDRDQFFRIEEGEAKFVVDGREFLLVDGEVFVVPAGSQHNIINNGDVNLRLYTIYAPAEHPEGTVQHDKPIVE